VEQVGTGVQRGALNPHLVPPEIANQRPAHGTDRPRARVRRSEATADGDQPLAKDGAQGGL